MPSNTYPEHDINQVFDYLSSVLVHGDTAENALDELTFINRLFSALPAEAVEYGMQFLHGNRDLPKVCDEILPLYIRFVNLIEYCETIEKLREIPSDPTTEQIMERMRMNESLDEYEKPFCKPLLGFAYNKDIPSEVDPTDLPEEDTNKEDEKKGSGLHLMNGCAPVFPCIDILQTARFYESYLGFESVHLDDEAMPHIRLARDNIEIILVEKKTAHDLTTMRDNYGILYDLLIYVSEPMLLQNELINAGITIVKPLEDFNASSTTNREFVIEDIDGRHICFSQREFGI